MPSRWQRCPAPGAHVSTERHGCCISNGPCLSSIPLAIPIEAMASWQHAFERARGRPRTVSHSGTTISKHRCFRHVAGQGSWPLADAPFLHNATPFAASPPPCPWTLALDARYGPISSFSSRSSRRFAWQVAGSFVASTPLPCLTQQHLHCTSTLSFLSLSCDTVFSFVRPRVQLPFLLFRSIILCASARDTEEMPAGVAHIPF